MRLTVGFSRSKKKFAPASWAIMAYQQTMFSHTYIRLTPKSLPSDIIIHASEGKVQRMSETQFDKRHLVVEEYKLDLPDDIYQKVKNEMHEISGDDYSIIQNVGIILVDFIAIFGKHIANPWQKGWNCSEFVMDMLKIAFPTKYDHIDSNTVTPKQIRNMLKKVY